MQVWLQAAIILIIKIQPLLPKISFYGVSLDTPVSLVTAHEFTSYSVAALFA